MPMDQCDHDLQDQSEVTIRGQRYLLCPVCQKRLRTLTCNHSTKRGVTLKGQLCQVCADCQPFLRKAKGCPASEESPLQLAKDSRVAKKRYRQFVQKTYNQSKSYDKTVQALQEQCSSKKSSFRHSSDFVQQTLTCLEHFVDINLCTACWELIDLHCIFGCRKAYKGEQFGEQKGDQERRMYFIILFPLACAYRPYRLPILEILQQYPRHFITIWHQLMPQSLEEQAASLPTFAAMTRFSANEYLVSGGSLFDNQNNRIEVTENCFVLKIKRSQVVTGDLSRRYYFSRQKISSLGVRRAGHASVLAQCGVVVAGGHNPVDGFLDSVQVYDFVEESWNKLPRLRTGRSRCCIFELNKTLYIYGGATKKGLNCEIQILGAGKSEWQTLSLKKEGLAGVSAFKGDNSIFLLGGSDNQSMKPTIQTFDSDCRVKEGARLGLTRSIAVADIGRSKKGQNDFACVFGGRNDLSFEVIRLQGGKIKEVLCQREQAQTSLVRLALEVEKDLKQFGAEIDCGQLVALMKREFRKCAIAAFS